MACLTTRSGAAFCRRIVLKPYGVLGTQLTISNGVVQRAPAPTEYEAFVDPAGLHYIHGHGPAGAGGAAGAIYQHIGISSNTEFPLPVRNAISTAGDAQLHCYNQKHYVIHTVGPDLRESNPSWQEACVLLGRAYYNVLLQFLKENSRRGVSTPLLTTLRLLPISGGIFAGAYQDLIAPLTIAAMCNGFRMLPTTEQRRLLQEEFNLHLCVFIEKEMVDFEAAHTAGCAK